MEGSESFARLTTKKVANRDRIFLPVNIDGYEESDSFMTTTKLIAFVVSAVLLAVCVLFFLNSGSPAWHGVLAWLFIFSFILRYVIFEERRFYKAYKRQMRSEFTTPAEFYRVVNIKESLAGSIIVFESGRIGALVKITRGTIVGRKEDFMGTHYDSVSDMYRSLLRAKYSLVILDVSESTGEDKAVDELGKLTTASGNKNINSLMEHQVGYIKSIVQRTIYSNEYIMIYSTAEKIDRILNDIDEAMVYALQGSISSYEILDTPAISTFMAEQFGVSVFSGDEAVKKGRIKQTLKIVEVSYEDGVSFRLSDIEREKVKKIRKAIEEGRLSSSSDVNLRRAFTSK